MDLTPPGLDHPRRDEVKAFLQGVMKDSSSPSATQLAAGGWVAPTWPPPWGRGADPLDAMVIDDELRAAGVERPFNPIGIGWAGPTLLAAGTPEQQERWLPGILDGSETWCQLFSEPGAGSDLAALTTRAHHDGNGWVVDGAKVWTSYADHSRWGILLARTDASASRHRGISYFVLDMTLPGIEVRPIREMTGQHHFNEVFLDGVRLPDDHLIGASGDGWRLATLTLANERISLSSGGVLWSPGPTTEEFVSTVRCAGGVADPIDRQRVAGVHVTGELLRLLSLRQLSNALRGGPPGPEVSVRKAMADDHGQDVMDLACDLSGAGGMLTDSGPLGRPGPEPGSWTWGLLFSRALTVGGGTAQVQRSIIGERILGLPREPS